MKEKVELDKKPLILVTQEIIEHFIKEKLNSREMMMVLRMIENEVTITLVLEELTKDEK